MSVTYYVAIPFVRTEEGDLAPGEAVEVQSEAAAKSRAKLMAVNAAGAICLLALRRPGSWRVPAGDHSHPLWRDAGRGGVVRQSAKISVSLAVSLAPHVRAKNAAL